MTYKEVDERIALPIEIDPISWAAYEAIQRLLMEDSLPKWANLPEAEKERLFTLLKGSIGAFALSVDLSEGVTA